MRTDLFDYELPPDRIAQEPPERRDASRLLVMARQGPLDLQLGRFADLPELLAPGDLLVVNDAKVVPARLWARRASGGVVEVLLLASQPGSLLAGRGRERWLALVRPARRVRAGDVLIVEEAVAGDAPGAGAGDDDDAAGAAGEAPDAEHAGAAAVAELRIEVSGELDDGRRWLTFPEGCDVHRALERYGEMPLPPYIERQRGDRRAGLDRRRYQTVYASTPGAVAAPTAGLHFSPELIDAVQRAGIEWAALTLHVGPGTFVPLRGEEVEEHEMEPERYFVPASTARAIDSTRARGGRIVAVGTTAVRALEHAALRSHGEHLVEPGPGSADLFIVPGHEFRVVDAMVTNFHLPRSTPILLVAALVGRQRLLEAYRRAVDEGLRFYSYGDAMLIR